MTTDIRVHRIDPRDAAGLEAVLELDLVVWAEPLKIPREVLRRHVPTRAAFIARRGEEDAGIAGSWDVEVSIPAAGGGCALRPVEGLTWVGVHPDHTRRGVLSALMRHHLRWTRDEQHRPLAALKASEPTIYGRFGYGVASSSIMSVFARGTDLAAPTAVRELADATVTRTTTASADQAERLHALARACGTTSAGHVVRARTDLERILADIPESRGEREPARLMWATRDGQDVGAAWFHRTPKWSDGAAEGRVGVILLVTADAGARLALGRRLTDIDLMATTECWVGADDPLALWYPSLRSVEGGMTDDLWLRIVDLPGAVAERGHAADVDVTVEVRDEIITEQALTWRWTARDGAGGCRPSEAGAAAEITLDIADLAAVWLGGQTLGARAGAGFVTEHRPGAVAELDAALRTPAGPVGAIDF